MELYIAMANFLTARKRERGRPIIRLASRLPRELSSTTSLQDRGNTGMKTARSQERAPIRMDRSRRNGSPIHPKAMWLLKLHTQTGGASIMNTTKAES